MRYTSRRLQNSLILFGLLLLLAVVVAACGSGSPDAGSTEPVESTVAETTSTTLAPTDEHDHEEEVHDHEHDEENHDHEDESADPDGDVVELDEARRLLVVAPHGEAMVDLIDIDDGTTVSIELDSPAAFSSVITESGRFLLAGHEDGVTVVDTGVWSEPHGDHFHHYASTPTVLGRVDGPNPTHLISHHNLNAIYFDGTGSALVVGEEGLEDGEVSVMAEVPTGEPHHGFAVPTHGAYFITVPTEDMDQMPNVVGVTGTDGVVQTQFDCPMTHGEASISSGAAAACSDGIALVREDEGTWTGSYLPYPQVDDEDPYGFGPARAWILQAAADQSLLAAPLGSQHLLIADPERETARAMDLERNIATLGVEFTEDGRLIVLTLDGFLHLVDPEDETVIASLEVITPFQEGDPAEPYRQIAATGEHVYVTDPANNQVIEVAVSDALSVDRTIDLDYIPGFLAIANG